MFAFKQSERGAVAVWVAISMTLLFIMLAVAVDVGYMHVTRAELQHAADGVAMAGAWALLNGEDVIDKTQEYAGYNDAASLTSLNLPEDKIIIGYMEDPLDIHSEIDTESEEESNTVEVYMQMDGSDEGNSKLNLLFGPIVGKDQAIIGARARAYATRRIIGFEANNQPGDEGGTEGESGGGELSGQLMPFAISEDYWNEYFSLRNGTSTITGTYGIYRDSYRWDPITREVRSGSDGIREIIIYPDNNNPLPGNYGTVDIGDSNNSTPDIERQIYYGISAEDIEALPGGQLVLNQYGDGEMGIILEADTGISNAIRHPVMGTGNWRDYPDLIGESRIFLIYGVPSDTTHQDLQQFEGTDGSVGQGNTGRYYIKGYVGCTIIHYKHQGNPKEFILQAVDVETGDNGQTTGGLNAGTDLIPIIHPDAPESDNLFAIGLCR